MGSGYCFLTKPAEHARVHVELKEYSMPNPIRDIFKDIRSRIDEFGWTSLSVFADDETGAPSFTYSIAFEEAFHSPEVIMIGFDPGLSQEIISIIAGHLNKGSLHLPEDKEIRIPNIIENFDVLARPVDSRTAEVLANMAFKTNSCDTRLIQICLPDKNGKFPCDPGCDPKFASYQDYTIFTPNKKLC